MTSLAARRIFQRRLLTKSLPIASTVTTTTSITTNFTSQFAPPTQSHSNSNIHCHSFSTEPATNLQHDTSAGPASTYMHGVTDEMVASNAQLQEFFLANFPEYFGIDPNNVSKKDEYDLTPFLEAEGLLEQVQSEFEEKVRIQEEFEARKVATPPNHIRPLSCFVRQGGKKKEEGSRKCRKMRNKPPGSAFIPGILYGSDPTQNILSKDASSKLLVKTPWSLLQREIDKYTYHNFESRVYDLTIYEHEDDTEGTVHRVTPQNVQYHPIQHKIYCCNYLRYFPGKPIPIPIEYINMEESAAMKRGGFIAPINRHVPCIIEEGVPIPEKIELECTGLRLKEVVRQDRLLFPEGVQISERVDTSKWLVGTVFGRKSEIGDEGGDEEAEGDDK